MVPAVVAAVLCTTEGTVVASTAPALSDPRHVSPMITACDH